MLGGVGGIAWGLRLGVEWEQAGGGGILEEFQRDKEEMEEACPGKGAPFLLDSLEGGGVRCAEFGW
jgi:hypothetical protein